MDPHAFKLAEFHQPSALRHASGTGVSPVRWHGQDGNVTLVVS
jgi:hypothetical protein